MAQLLHTFTNLTEELEEVVKTLAYIDVCEAILTGVPRAEDGHCYVDSYNCSAIPWWVKPKTFPSLHCLHSDEATRLMDELGPSCELYYLCVAKANPTTCTYVDNTMLFEGMNCSEVRAASAGLLGDIRCTMDSKANDTSVRCRKKTWAYWIHTVISEVLVVFHEANDALGDTVSCLWDWIKTWFGFLILIVDKKCDATPAEKIQFFLYYNLWSWTGCARYATAFVIRWKFSPINTGFWMIWDLLGEMAVSVIDGSWLSQSRYYCNALTAPQRGCAEAAESVTEYGCKDLLPGIAADDAPAGIMLEHLQCRDVGFSEDCQNVTCPPPGENRTGCEWFLDKSCMDSNTGGIHMIFIPNVQCTDLYQSCALRTDFQNSTDCRVFSGCSMMSWSGGCPENVEQQHIFTRRFFKILDDTLTNFTRNLLEMKIAGWQSNVSPRQVDQVTVVFHLVAEVLSCVVDAAKGIFGALMLILDPGCRGKIGEAITYLLDAVWRDGIDCLNRFSDAMYDLGWTIPANLWETCVDAVADIVPHLWTLGIFKSDTGFCAARVQFYFIEDKIIYEWTDAYGNPRWAYEGCKLFAGGTCEEFWDDCSPDLEICDGEDCLKCTDPLGSVFDALADTIEATFDMIIDATGFDKIPILASIFNAIKDILIAIIEYMKAMLITWTKLFIGLLIMIVDGGCDAPGKAKGMMFVAVLTRPFAMGLQCLIAVFRALGDVFKLLGEMIMTALRSTKLFDFIFDTIDDIRAVAYCFGSDCIPNEGKAWLANNESNTPSSFSDSSSWSASSSFSASGSWSSSSMANTSTAITEEEDVFYYPPQKWPSEGYPVCYTNYYNFPRCVSYWPGQYEIACAGEKPKCDLPGCFWRTWDCLQCKNVTIDHHCSNPRKGTFVLGLIKSNFMRAIMFGMLQIVNYPVCAVECIRVCDKCHDFKLGQIAKFLKCIFRCFGRPNELCVKDDFGSVLPSMESGLMRAIADYDCIDKCPCQTNEAVYACFLFCFVNKGVFPETDDPALQDTCELGSDYVLEQCNYIFDEHAADRKESDPDVKARQKFKFPFDLPPHDEYAAPETCHDFAPLFPHRFLISNNATDDVSPGMIPIRARYYEAEEFCRSTCQMSRYYPYFDNAVIYRGCVAFRMLLYDVDTPIATLLAFRRQFNDDDAACDNTKYYNNRTLSATEEAFCTWKFIPTSKMPYSRGYDIHVRNELGEFKDVSALLEPPHFLECGILDCRSFWYIKRLMYAVLNYATLRTPVTFTAHPWGDNFALTVPSYEWFKEAESPDGMEWAFGTTLLSSANNEANRPPLLLEGYIASADGSWPFNYHILKNTEEIQSIPVGSKVISMEDFIVNMWKRPSGERVRPAPFRVSPELLAAAWPHLPKDMSCRCYAVLQSTGQSYSATGFRERLEFQFCSTVRDLLKDNPGDKELQLAFCSMSTTHSKVMQSVRSLLKVTSKTVASPPLRETAAAYFVGEIFFGVENGYINSRAFEDLRDSVYGVPTVMAQTYHGSFVEAIIEDGYSVYKSPTRTVDDQAAWGMRSLDTLYEWIAKDDGKKHVRGSRSTARQKRRGTTGEKLQSVLRSLGARTKVERAAEVHSAAAESPKRGAPASLGAVSAAQEVRDPESNVTDDMTFLERWLPSTPRWWGTKNYERRAREYVFYPGSEQLVQSASDYGRGVLSTLQQAYHETSSKQVARAGSVGEEQHQRSEWDLFVNFCADAFAWLFETIKGWFDNKQGNFGDMWKEITDLAYRVVKCKSPQQYNGTAVYNLFCLAIPEGWLSWIPDKGEQITPIQIPWGDELVLPGSCVKEDWPEGQRPYWRLSINNCIDNQDDDEHFPSCPVCDYCKREYDPYAVRIDTFDCMLLTVHWATEFVNQIIDPHFGGNYKATWEDNVHFIINALLILGVMTLVAGYIAGPQIGWYIAIAVTAVYTVLSGFILQVGLALVLYFLYGGFAAGVWMGVFSVIMLVGGAPFTIDLCALVYDGLTWVAYGLDYVYLPSAWLTSFAWRFGRFAVGRDPVPRVYVQLYFIFMSKVASGLEALFLFLMAAITPVFSIMELVITLTIALINIVFLGVQEYRIHKLWESHDEPQTGMSFSVGNPRMAENDRTAARALGFGERMRKANEDRKLRAKRRGKLPQ